MIVDHDPGDEDREDRYEGMSTLVWTLAALRDSSGETSGDLIHKMLERDDPKLFECLREEGVIPRIVAP